jgi:hypothetical protein
MEVIGTTTATPRREAARMIFVAGFAREVTSEERVYPLRFWANVRLEARKVRLVGGDGFERRSWKECRDVSHCRHRRPMGPVHGPIPLIKVAFGRTTCTMGKGFSHVDSRPTRSRTSFDAPSSNPGWGSASSERSDTFTLEPTVYLNKHTSHGSARYMVLVPGKGLQSSQQFVSPWQILGRTRLLLCM